MTTVNKTKKRGFRFTLAALSVLILFFLALPMIIVIPMSFSGASSIEFPPSSFSLRWYESLLGNPFWTEAMRTSVIVAVSSSLLAVILGGLASYGLSKSQFPGKSFLVAQFTAPMIVPTIITAVALYIGFAKIKILGTMFGLIVSHTIVVIPFVVLIMIPVFETFDTRIERAARSLGASWFTAFTRVVLPNVLPSMIGAWFFAFIMSFDELVLQLFLSGGYRTVSKKMYNELVLEISPTITAVSTLLIAMTAIFLIAISVISKKTGSKMPIPGEK